MYLTLIVVKQLTNHYLRTVIILPQSLRAASAYGTPKPLRVRAFCLLRNLQVASLSAKSKITSK